MYALKTEMAMPMRMSLASIVLLYLRRFFFIKNVNADQKRQALATIIDMALKHE